jgi:hypothetical protein
MRYRGRARKEFDGLDSGVQGHRQYRVVMISPAVHGF